MLLFAYLALPVDLIPDSFPFWAMPMTQSSSRSCFVRSRVRPDRMLWLSTGPARSKGLRLCAACAGCERRTETKDWPAHPSGMTGRKGFTSSVRQVDPDREQVRAHGADGETVELRQ